MTLEEIVNKFGAKYRYEQWYKGVGIGRNNTLVVYYTDSHPKIVDFMGCVIEWKYIGDITTY